MGSKRRKGSARRRRSNRRAAAQKRTAEADARPAAVVTTAEPTEDTVATDVAHAVADEVADEIAGPAAAQDVPALDTDEAPAVEQLFAESLLRQLRDAADNVAHEVRTNEATWCTSTDAAATVSEPPAPASESLEPAVLLELVDRLTSLEGELTGSAPAECPMRGETVEPVLEKIQAEVVSSRSKSESALSTLRQLATEVNEMRVQLSAFGKVAVRNGVRLGELGDALKAQAPPRPQETAEGAHREARAFWQTPLFAGGAVLVLLSWAVLLHFKTGNVKLVLGAVALANLAGCMAIMVSRQPADAT